MTALSINLPDDLAKASREAAHKLGVSRAYFIRQAIAHELEHVKPPTIFICSLSSQSQLEFKSFHIELPARENLHVTP